MGTPVVEDPRDVRDPVAALGQPQDHVDVLGAVEVAAKPAQLLHQRAAVDAEMAGVAVGAQRVRRPPGLQMGPHLTAVHQRVLVGVDHVQPGLGGDPAGHVVKRVGGERVVMVEQCDVVAGGLGHRGVGGLRNATGRVVAHELDPGVGARVTLEGGEDLGVGGAVVDQAQLPLSEGLGRHGGDRLIEHPDRRVVNRYEDRDEGAWRGKLASPAREAARGAPAAGGGTGGAPGSVRVGETQIARSRDATRAAWGRSPRDCLGSSVSTPNSRAAVPPGSRHRTSAPRGESRASACRVQVQSVERSPPASATVTDIRTAPRRSRQSWGNSIARAQNSVSCESTNGKVAVLPDGDDQDATRNPVGIQQPPRRPTVERPAQGGQRDVAGRGARRRLRRIGLGRGHEGASPPGRRRRESRAGRQARSAPTRPGSSRVAWRRRRTAARGARRCARGS